MEQSNGLKRLLYYLLGIIFAGMLCFFAWITAIFLLFFLTALSLPIAIVYFLIALAMVPFLIAIISYFSYYACSSKAVAIWERWRGYLIRLLIPFTLIFCMTSFAIEDYQQKITVPASTMIQLEDYLPFHNDSQLAKLDHQASLQLTNDLPKLDGATALVPVYAAFVHAVYPAQGYNYDFYNTPMYYYNTIGGYNALFQGERDIMFGAYPSEDQLQYATECDAQLTFTPIGQEGFVFFVNATNPVNQLTSEQLRGIYSGEITNWQEVGGENRKIEAFQRNANSGSQSALIRFMQNRPLMEPPQDKVQDLMSGIIYRAADYKNHSNAIGFSFRYYAQDMIADKGIKLLAIDGIAPTIENIGNGSYPLTSNFYAVTTQHSNANSQLLIDWILSPEGQQLIEETGYAGINPDK